VKAIPEPIEISEGSNETGESRVIGGGSFRTDDRMPLNGRPISSPKRDGHAQTSWEKFFPYYAGFPEAFASDVLEDLKLKPGATVLDPWNGSGTTTYAAVRRGYKAIGLDLNPVMVIVSRARMLPFSEIDALEPLAKTILQGAVRRAAVSDADPLLSWFDADTAIILRSIERSINKKLVGSRTLSPDDVDLGQMSSIAASFYISLFSVARGLTKPFRSTNPTWLRTGDGAIPIMPSGKHRHERSRTQYRPDAGEPALRRQNPLRRRVPVAGGARQEALPHARRCGGIRRTNGKPERAQARPVHQGCDRRAEGDSGAVG
jgi:SAM-dependent methyltransferase